MSDYFPEFIYTSTGDADGIDFTKFSGYCYKNVGTTTEDEELRDDFDGIFENCLDCNTCKCNKQIEFIVGGFLKNNETEEISFNEKSFKIFTSSTGWQEIAIESGFLNSGNNNLEFKPSQIRCYDRKIDIQSGIYASFYEREAEIAHFQYVTGMDLYERQDQLHHAQTGKFGPYPLWDHQNQFDKVRVANKLNTIKFKSLCETKCPTQDITFRIRGGITENSNYLNLGASETDVTSWVYATCTGVPTTEGQIIECIPSGSGINITDYFVGNYTGKGGQRDDKPPGYALQMDPQGLEIVNLELLKGEKGTDLSKKFSVTGAFHFTQDNFDYNYYAATTTTTTNFYYLKDNYYVDVDYSSEIGQEYGLDYLKAPNCIDPNVSSSDFTTYYRHYGANTVAFEGILGQDFNTGCFQASEFADGIYKNGTYVPMMWTGLITGNSVDYTNFIDDGESFPPDFWETGVYIYQWYTSGDRSIADNITGFFGYLTGEFNDTEVQNHYRSVVMNSSPVNTDNPLYEWDVRSGYYPVTIAKKKNYTVLLNAGAPFHSCLFEHSTSGLLRNDFRTYERGTQTPDTIFDNYFYNIPQVENFDAPFHPTNTFSQELRANSTITLTDSGNADNGVTNIDITLGETLSYKISNIESLKFQLSWKKTNE